MKRRSLILIGLLLFISTLSFGASVKISNLPASSSVTGTNIIPLVQNSTTTKATIDQVWSYLFSNLTPSLASKPTISTTAPVNHQIAIWTDATHIKGVSVTPSKVMKTGSTGEPTFCTNLTDTAYAIYPAQSAGTANGKLTSTGTPGQEHWVVPPVPIIYAAQSTTSALAQIDLGTVSAGDIFILQFQGGLVSSPNPTYPYVWIGRNESLSTADISTQAGAFYNLATIPCSLTTAYSQDCNGSDIWVVGTPGTLVVEGGIVATETGTVLSWLQGITVYFLYRQ